VHCESRVAAAVAWEQFENTGKRTSAVGNWYQGTGEEQLTEKMKFVCSEL
jgi:hypothetical protein